MSLGIAGQSIAVSVQHTAAATAAAAEDDTKDGDADPGVVKLAVPKSAEVIAAVKLINSKLDKFHCDRNDEKVIIDCLVSLSPQTLTETLLSLDCQKLISKVDDRLIGPDRRTELLTAIGEKRLNDLSIEAKAHWVTALQRTSTVTQPIAQSTVVKVLTGSKGDALWRLKRLIDLNYCTTDLHGLIWFSLTESQRNQVLAHFRAEAAAKAAAYPKQRKPCKVLSDIDDTLIASLFDYSYPGSTIYPGMRQLYIALDAGGGDGKDCKGDLVFLTARPSLGGSFRYYTYVTLRDKYGVSVPFSMLNGTLSTALSNTGMANKKHMNFVEYKACYPEYQFVFMGDSGQGDIMLGQKMMADIKTDQKTAAASGGGDQKSAAAAAAPAQSALVMIHDIRLKGDAPKSDAATRAQLLQSDGIVVFDSYITAALTAFKHHLVTRDNLLSVVEAARADFKKITWKDTTLQAKRLAELEDAATAVGAYLASIDGAAAKS